MNNFLDVVEFHEKFDLPRGQTPQLMEPENFTFRYGFLLEEIDEFNEACAQNNLVGALDALIDYVYVACGTALFVGCPRVGSAAEWPDFESVKRSAFYNGLIKAQRYGAITPMSVPRLLTPAMLKFATHLLRARTECFELAYHGALNEEPGTIELAVHCLKIATNTAFTIASLMVAPWEQCWRHVHAANMKKQRAKSDGSNSKRGSSFDVIKPAGWVAPEAKIALELQIVGWTPPGFLEIDNFSGKVRVREAA